MVSLGVEDVPKLHEDKNREEQRKLFGGEISTNMMEIEIAHKIITKGKLSHGIDAAVHEILNEAEQNRHKQQPHAEDASTHVLGDDESVARAWLVFQDGLIGRQGSQGHRREGVHYQVDPEHLGHGETG